MRLDPAPETGWLSARQVAELLELTQSRVNQLRREGQLPATRFALGWMFPRPLIEEVAEQRRHPA